MAKAKITFPDGRTAVISGDSEEDVQRRVQELEEQYYEFEKEEKPKMGLGAAIANTLTQGFTAGWSDEIAAGMDAAVRAPFSEQGFGDIYQQNLEVERARLAEARERFPKSSIASEIFGGIVGGGKIAKLANRRAPNLMNRIPSSVKFAGGGAAGGAVYGAGAADENKLQGAAMGGTVGAVASPVGAGAIKLGGKVIKALGKPLVNALQNSPRQQAVRILQQAIEEGDISEAQLRAQLRELGPEATLADVADSLQRLARGTAAFGGKSSTMARSFLEDRQAGQQTRLLGGRDMGDFKDWFHKFTTRRIAKADDYYAEAFSTPLQITDRLGKIMERPIMRVLLKKAEKELQNSGGGGSHIHVVQMMKEELDDKIGSLYRAGKKNKARRLIQLKNEWLAEIDEQIPAYKQAREIFAGEAAMRDAANLGRSMFDKRKIDMEAVGEIVEQMTDGEKFAFRSGAMRSMVDVLETASENRNMAGKLIGTKRAREVLSSVFPDEESFNQFMARARAESRFSDTRNMVLHGSPTSRIDADKANIETAAGITQAIAAGTDPVAGVVNMIRHLGLGDVSKETLEELTRMLYQRNVPARTIRQITPRTPSSLIERQGRALGGTLAGTHVFDEESQ